MPQDRKALAGIEQTGDTRAKVPLASVRKYFYHIPLGIKSAWNLDLKKKLPQNLVVSYKNLIFAGNN